MTDYLHDYIDAEETGRAMGGNNTITCEEKYSACPVSMFNLFKKPPANLDYNSVAEEWGTEDDDEFF